MKGEKFANLFAPAINGHLNLLQIKDLLACRNWFKEGNFAKTGSLEGKEAMSYMLKAERKLCLTEHLKKGEQVDSVPRQMLQNW